MPDNMRNMTVSSLILFPKAIYKLACAVYDAFFRWYCPNYLRFFGAELDPVSVPRFNGRCILQLKKSCAITIGEGVVINSGARSCADTGTASKIVVLEGAELIISSGSGLSNTVIQCRESISIGSNVSIGCGTFIMDNNFHSTDWKLRQSGQDGTDVRTAPVTICDNAFIGANCTICKGVTIGERSMICTGSVVVSDIPADCLAGGNPCVVIKKINN